MDTLHDLWNTLKKSLSRKSRFVFCRPGQIWWCSIGMNVGREIYGKNELFERPVLVIAVYSREIALVIPFTSQETLGKSSVPIETEGTLSYALFAQARCVSTKRFSRTKGFVPQEELDEILKKYMQDMYNHSRREPAMGPEGINYPKAVNSILSATLKSAIQFNK